MLKARVPLLAVVLVLLCLGGVALASRNSGGTYSLPAGNPVVSGTTITSTWANTTLNDIKTELTNSLDRQGRGGMLAPLQLVAGTVGAPGLTFSLEPGSGAYRAAAGDWRLTTLGTAVLKLQSAAVTTLVPLTVTGRTTTTDLTVTGTSEDITIVPTSIGSYGLMSTGNGTGIGVLAAGGATNADGLSAFGGGTTGTAIRATPAESGIGIVATGGTTSGTAITATALGGNSTGVIGIGFGSGSGGNFYSAAAAPNGTAALNGIGQGANNKGVWGTGTGTEPGVKAEGGASGPGLSASAGTSASTVARIDAIQATNGDISLNGVANPQSDVVFVNRITPKNINKAWAKVSIAAASVVTLGEGFNISSISPPVAANIGASCGNNAVVITFASSFASATSFAVIPGQGSAACTPYVDSQTATTATIRFSAHMSGGDGLSTCNVGCGVGVTPWTGTEFTILAVGAQ